MSKKIEKYEDIKNGDVFDIGQTVNGRSKFMFWIGKWYYYDIMKHIYVPYEYSNEDLTETVLNTSGLGDIKFLFNCPKDNMTKYQRGFDFVKEPEGVLLANASKFGRTIVQNIHFFEKAPFFLGRIVASNNNNAIAGQKALFWKSDFDISVKFDLDTLKLKLDNSRISEQIDKRMMAVMRDVKEHLSDRGHNTKFSDL